MKLQNIMSDRKHLYESQSVQLREKNRYNDVKLSSITDVNEAPHIHGVQTVCGHFQLLSTWVWLCTNVVRCVFVSFFFLLNKRP